MGFIWKKAYFARADIESLTAEACVKLILDRCAQAIIDTNTGWVLDTTNHASQSLPGTPISLKSTAQDTDPCYAYYLRNTTTSDKFLLMFNYGYSSSASLNPLYGTATSSNASLKYNLFNNQTTTPQVENYCTGLECSILDGRYDSSENFTEQCDSNSFLPTHATRLLGLNIYSSQQNIVTQRAASNYGTGATFYFGCAEAGNCIVVQYRSDNLIGQSVLPTRIYGKIYSSLFNPSDQDAYGAIRLWNIADSYNNAGTNNNGSMKDTDVPYISDVICENLAQNGRSYPDSHIYFSALAHATGGDVWLSGQQRYSDSNSQYCYATQCTICTKSSPGSNLVDYVISSRLLKSTLGASFKLPNPMVCFTYSNQWALENYGIISGCGIKGTIDQNVISFIPGGSTRPFASGTLIDNGYTLVTGAAGVCLGWHPDNPSSVNPYLAS